jgi:polysaccharide export outer membrane protein
MTARMLVPRCRPLLLMTGLLLAASAGCHGFAQKHEAKSIPQLGTIDASQPAEMRKVSQSPYVIEPPDELEITTNPPFPTSMTGPFIVQGDGFVDLGLFGEAYVYGLTLAEAEERLTVQINDSSRVLHPESKEKYRVSVRLANTQSKYYYVLGTVANPGRFKAGGNDTVLDAIVQAGLKPNSLPQKAYLVRPHALGGDDQVYKIDWFGIKDRGDTLTNYQVFPGDRVVVPGTKPPGLIRSLLGN